MEYMEIKSARYIFVVFCCQGNNTLVAITMLHLWIDNTSQKMFRIQAIEVLLLLLFPFSLIQVKCKLFVNCCKNGLRNKTKWRFIEFNSIQHVMGTVWYQQLHFPNTKWNNKYFFQLINAIRAMPRYTNAMWVAKVCWNG